MGFTLGLAFAASSPRRVFEPTCDSCGDPPSSLLRGIMHYIYIFLRSEVGIMNYYCTIINLCWMFCSIATVTSVWLWDVQETCEPPRFYQVFDPTKRWCWTHQQNVDASHQNRNIKPSTCGFQVSYDPTGLVVSSLSLVNVWNEEIKIQTW